MCKALIINANHFAISLGKEMYRQRESAKGNHKQPATGKNEVQRHFRRTIPTDREGGKKDKVLCDRLLLSANEKY